MGRISLHKRTLEKARTIAGGVQKLSGQLHIPVDVLERFLDGRENVPTWVFLRAVDLINDFEEALYRQMFSTPSATIHVLKTKL